MKNSQLIMKRLFKGVLFLLLLIPFKGFTQGGNTCAAAAASPIAIPFTGPGTLCAATTTDDYDMVGSSCMDPLNTQGPDWLYYFCATTTGTINVTLTNMTFYCYDPTQVAPFPALSVWQGCPGTGTCVSGTTCQGSPEVAVSANVTAGQCYYILIDNYPGYCPCFDYTLGVSYIPTPPVQPSCTNMGFDAGSFTGWSGTYGYTVHDGPTGAPTPTYNPVTFAIAAPQHTITSGAGVDPLGGFPVVCPGYGPNSAMLGDGTGVGYGGATLEQTFQVTASNALLTYQYAVVIQDANGATAHTTEQQPFFKIEVFDCAGNPIACGQYLVVGGPGIPGFTLCPGTVDVYYRPWTPVAVDLTPYIGSCAKIKFTVGDCSLGAHFAYAYLDVQCNPMAITGPNFICPGTSTTLNAPAGAAVYSWSPGGATTQSITVSPATNTTYSCTITSVAGPACTTLLTYPVSVYPPASVSATNTTVCAGTAATITATPTVGGGTYSWSPGGGTTSSITVTPGATTTYVCTYTDLNGCTDTANATVTVTPLPATAVNSPSICPGDTAHLIATGATTYAWSAGVTVTGPNTADASPAATTSYTVTGTTGACSSTAVATVTNGGAIAIAVNSPTICNGSTATLSASGGTTYTWSAGAAPLGVNTATASPSTTTTYTVTGATGTCTGTAVSTVTVNPLPVTIVNSPSVCAGTAATLTAGGATTYSWSAGAASTGVTTASASPAATTTYTVTGTSAGCTSTAVSTVTINPPPVSNAGPDLLLCTANPGNLGTAATAGDTYAWNPGTGLSSTTASNPAVTLTNAGASAVTTTYTVTTTSSAGCTSTDAVNVTVDPVQTANAGSPQSLCFGSSVTLAGSVGGSATGGTWSGGSGTFSPNANTLNATYTPGAADTVGGSVTLTLTSSSSGPCPFASSNVTLTFLPSPVVAFTSTPPGCPPLCVIFTDNSVAPGGGSIVSWSWDFGDGGTATGSPSPSHCYSSSGFYNVGLTVTSANGCSATLTIPQFVQVYYVPNALFAANPPSSTIFDGVISFTDESTTHVPGNIVSWAWDFGDGTTSNVQNPPPHQFPVDNPGTYNVTLTVVNNDGCTATYTLPVEIGPEFTFYIPNCFTPNDDGVNDYFFGDGIGIVKYDIWIFDRWGNQIFHGDYLHDKWDGRANGGKDVAQQDVYVWKVLLTDVFERKHHYIGTVTIVK
ncbi:MAG: PKD domain-containing protein [Bacteroidia bacterium]